MFSRLPVWMWILLGAQLALALLFFAFTWSLTASLAHSYRPGAADLLFLAMPILGVVVCGALASLLWPRGQKAGATILALMPVPLALVMLLLTGAVF
ncbi:MAG: hypothetical protein AB7F98_02120 [Novosphingobium sp.]